MDWEWTTRGHREGERIFHHYSETKLPSFHLNCAIVVLTSGRFHFVFTVPVIVSRVHLF